MKCQHLLKKDRAAYKLYAKDTTEKMKTDLKLYDRDGDGENPWKEKNTIPTKELNSLHLKFFSKVSRKLNTVDITHSLFVSKYFLNWQRWGFKSFVYE